MSHKTLITVLATVQKGRSNVPVEVAEHEIPILKYIHGDDKVLIVERDYGTLDVPDSAELELARLVGKYDDKHARNVAAVYLDLDRLAKHVGLETTFDPLAIEHAGPAQSVQIDDGKAERKAKATAARAKKTASKTTGRQGSSGK